MLTMLYLIATKFQDQIAWLMEGNVDGDVVEIMYHPETGRFGAYYKGFIDENGTFVHENRSHEYTVHLLEDDTWMCDECWQETCDECSPFDVPVWKARHLTTVSDDPRYTGCRTCCRPNTYTDHIMPTTKENTMNAHPIIPLLSDAYVAWDVDHSWLVLTVVPKEGAEDTLFRDFKYEVKTHTGGKRYFAENEFGMVSFYGHGMDPSENLGGFGGCKVPLNMVDGSTITLVGPWSSSPTCMMEMGFPSCDDVVVAPSTSAHMAFPAMQAVIDHFCPGFTVSTDATDWADDGPEHINYRTPHAEYNRIWPTTGKPLSYKDGIARRRTNG